MYIETQLHIILKTESCETVWITLWHAVS